MKTLNAEASRKNVVGNFADSSNDDSRQIGFRVHVSLFVRLDALLDSLDLDDVAADFVFLSHVRVGHFTQQIQHAGGPLDRCSRVKRLDPQFVSSASDGGGMQVQSFGDDRVGLRSQ